MITSQLRPSRVFGSVTTTVCCPAFTCFVRTSRRAFVTANWETAFFEVSPNNDENMRLRVRFGYRTKMKHKAGQLLHAFVSLELDKIGETTSNPLGECLSTLVHKLRETNIISWVTFY